MGCYLSTTCIVKFYVIIAEENASTWFFVGLVSDTAGWVLPQRELLAQINDGSLSYSAKNDQYKINPYNFPNRSGFQTIKQFKEKIAADI